MTPGIHLVHKPIGTTSFSLVRAFQDEARQSGAARIPLCHGGVLDPFAEGLVLLLVGQATRLMELIHPAPKRYVATVAWGVETDNGDLHGAPVSRGDSGLLAPAALDEALSEFLGWRDQVPPVHSNKKVAGVPAYQRVLRGEQVSLPPSRVYLHAARWVSHALPESSVLELTCRGGYYVRSLARDLGRRLGCGAHLRALRRPAIGPWEDPGEGPPVVVTGRGLLPWAKVRELDDAAALDLSRGKPIPRGEILPPDWPVPENYPDPGAPIRGLHRGRLVALLRESDGLLATFANLRGGL